jgi:hypothetical protein
MIMQQRIYCLIILSLMLGGCTKMKIEDFDNTTPQFVLEDYFAGKTRAWGMFEDRFGRIQRQFVVDITGEVDGKTLTLREDFVYNDGEKETRIWVLEKTSDTTYEGTTDNVIGVAKGTINGNAFNWIYDFNLKVDDSYWKVKFDDWMILQPDGVLLNKATVTRWGIKLGTVYISFNRVPVKAANDAEFPAAASQQMADIHKTAVQHPNGLYVK